MTSEKTWSSLIYFMQLFRYSTQHKSVKLLHQYIITFCVQIITYQIPRKIQKT